MRWIASLNSAWGKLIHSSRTKRAETSYDRVESTILRTAMTATPRYDFLFWRLAADVADLLGPRALRNLLTLYLAVQHADTPVRTKIQATGALSALMGHQRDGVSAPLLSMSDLALIDASLAPIASDIPRSVHRSADIILLDWLGMGAA